MELLDLNDDVIIGLFKFCDNESKLNLMATCKRFEFLIGNNLELFKEFKLTLDTSKLKASQVLLKIRRQFGTVSYNVFEKLSDKEFEVVLGVLQIIGEKVVDLEIKNYNLSADSIIQILERVSNISSLKLEWVRFEKETPITSPPKLPNLKSLELDGSIDHSLFNQLFPSTLSLNDFTMNSSEDEDENMDHWKIVQEIITTNSQLKTLSLSDFKCINNFECPTETEFQLEKLELYDFEIEEKSVVDNFTRFIKTQKNIKNLHIESLTTEYCYKEVLTHLLNLESLENLFLQFHKNVPIFDIMKMENPNLKTLEVYGNVDDRLFSFFPNIQTLKIRVYEFYLRDEFYVSVNSLEYLRELFMHHAKDGKIQHICVENLEKLEIENFEFSDSDECVAAWDQFTKNNSGIKHLTLDSWTHTSGNFLNHLDCIVENLTNLKILKLDLKFESEIEIQAVEIIGKICANLKYVELKLRKEVAEKAAALFTEKSPLLKFKFNENDDDLFRDIIADFGKFNMEDVRRVVQNAVEIFGFVENN